MTEPSARSSAFADDSLPERYERLLAASLFEPWAEVLLDAVGLPKGADVLDVAAGTGVVSRAAARRAASAGSVLATDISPAMLAFAGTHRPESGAAPIETAVAGATSLGGPDERFDVALCQQGLPFIPDRAAALAEMRRVLRPGGVIGIAVWTPGHDLVPFGPMIAILATLGVPEPFPGAFDQSTFVLTAEEVGDLLAEVGFRQIDSREVELVTHWPAVDALVDAVHGTPLGSVLQGLDAGRQETVRRMLGERYTPWVTGDGTVDIPTYSVIARAER